MYASLCLLNYYMRFQVLTAASKKFKVFWDVAPCSHVEVDRRFKMRTASIIRVMMMESVRTSETSVNFNLTTRLYIPDDSSKLLNYCRFDEYSYS
jgi:hypothetical protein